jgi:hypothetical protein
MLARYGGALYEGAFASRVLGQNLETLAPFASVPAGESAWRAGTGGLLQGRFGWGDPNTGLVLNTQTTDADALGVVIPLQSVNGANGGVIGGPASLGGRQAQWSWQTWDRANRAWRLRAGIVATLMNAGNFWLRFPGSANYGDQVYVSLADGTAISGGPAVGSLPTPWRVCGDGGPNALIIVSSTASF